MKKLILSALLALSVLASFAQTNTTVLRSRVTDSTTVTTVPTGWGAMYYNAQDSKWRVYEDGSWRDIGSGSGGGSSTWGGITGDIGDQQDLLNYVAESIDSVTGVSDGDKGDITVTSSGSTWTIDNLAVTAAKLATLSSSDLAGKLTDETGSGAAVFGTGPVINPATNVQTGSYTLALTDASKYVDMNVAGANNLTVPPNTSVAFPIGTTITVTQVGAGLTSIVQGSGVTVTSSATVLTSPGQNSPMVLRKTGTDTWYLYNGRQITGSALTKLDDTNVTMTLTGTPLTSLLQSVSLELGWTGQLSAARGGTGTDTPSGTYTPTLTSVANIGASTAHICTYTRLNNSITVSGVIEIDPTSTGSTQIGISLPVASAFTADDQCAGTAVTGEVASHSAAIRSDATNDRAEIIYVTTDTSNRKYSFSFTYRIL